MATVGKTLALGQITDTTLTSIYTAPTGINARISVVGFTNTGSTGVTLDIYHSSGGTDYLVRTMTLPAGSGNERIYYGFQRRFIDAGAIIKVQSSAAITFNYHVHGSEIELVSS